MQICDKQYQSLNISASPAFATAQGRENERRGWTKEVYDAKNREPGNRYDWSRHSLNFEVMRGRRHRRPGSKLFHPPTIIPLGTQPLSLKERYEKRLEELDYKPWSKDAPNQPNTCVDFVFSGDHDRMAEIAFGKPMDFDWREDNSSVVLADDPNHPGRKQIETMALDLYDFLCRHFGEENVMGLECHLDETTPHFHALVIPVAMRTKRGRVGGYELKPDVVNDDKELSEHITTRQYQRMSEDRKQLYQPAEKKVVPTVSYSYYFGETQFAARQSYREWHTMLHDEVGDKWGLERGEDTSLMTPEERKDHRKKGKRLLERERLMALEETEKAEQEAREAKEKSTAASQKLNALENAVSEKQRALDRLTGSEKEAQKELERINKEKEEAAASKAELEDKVEELAEAVGDPKESVAIRGFCETVFVYNPSSNGVIIDNLKVKGKTKVTMLDVIQAAFEERDKVKARKIGFFTDTDEFKKQQDTDIKNILTDMQTILRSFDSVHIQELTRRSRAIVKKDMRENAVAIQKLKKYDEMAEKGITEGAFNEAKKKADEGEKAEKVLGVVWPGLWNAVKVVTDQKLDQYAMNDKDENTIRAALESEPRSRLIDVAGLLKVSKTIRDIDPRTETEVWEIGAETGVEYLKKLGIDMAEGVTKDIEDVAATTACLFFGFLDGATNISETCDGGGGNNELPKKKDDEDELSFAKRCHQMARDMHAPRPQLRKGRS